MNRIFIVFLIPVSLLLGSPNPTEFLDFATSSQLDDHSLQQIEQETIDFDDLVQFMKDFKAQLELRYGVTVEMTDAINLAKNSILSSTEFSNDEKSTIISYYDLLLDKFRSHENDFLGFGNKKKKPSLELPGKLAAGFICCLSGASMCVIPFPAVQSAGVGLITTGIGLAMDGLSNGEKPYYVDPVTGNRIP